MGNLSDPEGQKLIKPDLTYYIYYTNIFFSYYGTVGCSLDIHSVRVQVDLFIYLRDLNGNLCFAFLLKIE